MPQNDDPYATPRARMFDLLLFLITLALIGLMVVTAPRPRHAKAEANRATRSDQLVSK